MPSTPAVPLPVHVTVTDPTPRSAILAPMRPLLAPLLLLLPACATSTEPRAPPAAPEPTPPSPVEASPPAPLGFSSLEDQSLYLVLLDRFHDGDQAAFPGRDPADPLAFHGGDLAGLLEKLPYLADLGVTALWITPVHRQVAEPVGPEGERHWPLHGYWPEDHTTLDPRFGSEQDLRAVVEKAHALGLRVVLDVVTNHFGYGAASARDDALVRSNERGTCPDDGGERTQCLFGLPDLRSEDPRVRALVVDWTTSWVERFGVDGFRLDAAKHVPPELLWEVHDRAERLTRARGAPGFLALAEHWGATPGDDVVRAYTESGAADTLFDFSFAGLVEGFLTGRLRAEALAHHLEQWHAADGPPLVHSLDTHDTSTLVHRLGDDARHRYPLAAFLQMSVRGVPLVTWGDELARGGGEWPDNRGDMPWAKLDDDGGRALHGTWRALLHLRRRSPSLHSRAYAGVLAKTDDESGTIAFRRGDDRLVIVHRGPARARALEGLPPGALLERCVSHGAWSQSPLQVDDEGRLSLEVPSDGAAVLSLHTGGCEG